MKFNCGPTYEEKRELKKQWHDFFALLPIRVGSRDCRWLETVQRRGILGRRGYWSWEYRAKEPT